MVLHLVIHVMVNEGMSITLLKHDLIENHDGHHLEAHLVEEMNWNECNPIIFELV